jgi:membrane-associated phospholipid phosphatase
MDVRLTGLSRVLFDLLPPSLEPAYFAVTLLGDTVVVTGLLALLYWAYGDRRRTLTAVGYGFVGFGAIVALKGFFAAPRPAAALIEAHGYGFPSGHALGATVVYGGLALEHGWLEDRRKAAGIGVLVAAVAFSRVALRVHYLGDVLAGVAVGVAALLATRGLADGAPRYTFAVAAWLAVPALYFAGGSADAWGVLGGALGGLVASTYVSAAPERGSRREVAALVAVGLPLVGAAKLGADALPPVPGAAGVDEFAIVLVVVLLPVAFERAGVQGRLAT